MQLWAFQKVWRLSFISICFFLHFTSTTFHRLRAFEAGNKNEMSNAKISNWWKFSIHTSPSFTTNCNCHITSLMWSTTTTTKKPFQFIKSSQNNKFSFHPNRGLKNCAQTIKWFIKIKMCLASSHIVATYFGVFDMFNVQRNIFKVKWTMLRVSVYTTINILHIKASAKCIDIILWKRID